MYIKKSNFVIYLALSAVVGCGATYLINGINAQSGLSSGDISKVSGFSNQKEDPATALIEEKLRNDQAFSDDTRDAMDFLQNRIVTLNELTEQTLELCSGYAEFEPLMLDLKSLNAKSHNTGIAMSNAKAGLEKLLSGKPAPEYEIYSNQAYLGFSKIENQLDFGQKFYELSSAYLAGKEGKEYEKLADMALVWSVYCAQDAYMNEAEKSMEYWKSKYDEMNGPNSSMISDQLKKALSHVGKNKIINGAGSGSSLKSANLNKYLHESVADVENFKNASYKSSLSEAAVRAFPTAE